MASDRGSPIRLLVGWLSYPVAALIGYIWYWLAMGLSEKARLVVVATIHGPPADAIVFSLAMLLCILLGGLVAGGTSALLWPRRRLVVITASLGALVAWLQIVRMDPGAMLRIVLIDAEIVVCLVGIAVAHTLVSSHVNGNGGR